MIFFAYILLHWDELFSFANVFLCLFNVYSYVMLFVFPMFAQCGIWPISCLQYHYETVYSFPNG